MGNGIRLVIFTPVRGAYKALAAVVFGITYSLGAVFTGIAFVPVSIAKPVIGIFRRKPNDAGSTELASVDRLDEPTDVAIVEPIDVPAEVTIVDAPDDSTGVPTDDAIVEPTTSPDDAPIEPTVGLAIEDSYPEDDGPDLSEVTGATESTRSTFLDMIQNSVSAIRQLPSMLRPSTVTLSMEEDAIRLLVFRGRRIVGWDYITLKSENENSGEVRWTPSIGQDWGIIK